MTSSCGLSAVASNHAADRCKKPEAGAFAPTPGRRPCYVVSGSALAVAAEVTLLAALLVDEAGPPAGWADIGFRARLRRSELGQDREHTDLSNLCLHPLAVLPQHLRQGVGKREYALGAEAHRPATADPTELIHDLTDLLPRSERGGRAENEGDQPSQRLGKCHDVAPRAADVDERLEWLAVLVH